MSQQKLDPERQAAAMEFIVDQQNGIPRLSLVEDQRRQITSLTAMVAKLEKDAARYRWLRQCVSVDDPRAVEIVSWDYTADELDAAIDAARNSLADAGSQS